ncbi:hypothetical protein FIBSPDRAFT_1044891 [Athelia psychrophila]|uniref:NB-ARC domain-containing protein n=1 Tax=Athelia psychrophila TaxID=1759441 RepID=A0A166J377_9AGAM|nr:hypothetical protein FIBSPDRAFT_1044891 [Fibularhizoctonia sp. CBS 109695]
MGTVRLQCTIDELKTAHDNSDGPVLQIISTAPSQLVPPEHFFGRKEIISTLVNLFVGNERYRIAILSAGGLGKTSLALHLIHRDIVAKRFSDHEFFVGCDGITSAGGLASRILHILGVPGAASGDAINVLHDALREAFPTLLPLDNLESTWDAPGDHSAIQDLLQKIASVDSVRNPMVVFPRGSDGDDAALDELLKELNYVPLAIHLLAQMIRLPTAARLQSVDMSVSLSITSLDAAQNPGSVQLLGMLCLLPDGLHAASV